ncbi:hypothetical protein MKUB_26470 [Mycobacterium kubicae]|uniref:Lipoprotein n=1 Tax=Mycobacterium kubicae TaxID=120959 RepID=A0AAX1JIE1_9MYCO|nr:hypothetical protein [Mycobacterium kubicae]MCV7096013.1 hypothetical protein [Mycobacterium kubicae]OBF23731.1 hypothetical protein A5725_09120 [Mycobacterium kubicae]ORV99303.1 hypothetical protein AWC13_11170 [Mycobacterium kubicae]QNI12175.1 hypothetical protein GAN18_14015 [Mycobacterium kubicae]QPI40405.1 hypothetical protein I2456_13820 [Mycobacterium kubicae]
MHVTERSRIAARTAAVALVLAGYAAGSAGFASADPAPTPPPAPKTTIDHDGTFAVGTEIAPGTYSTAGPVGNGTCYWKRLGNPDGALIDNSLSKKPQTVQIEATDKAFKTDGCQPWQITDAPAPAELPGPAAGGQLQANLGALNGLLGPTGQHVP